MPATETCKVCRKPLYPGCNNATGGGGSIIQIVNGRGMARLCPNIRRFRLERYLESIDNKLASQEIRANRASPLFQAPDTDRTRDNLFFPQVNWHTFLSNLKWVAANKVSQGLRIETVTDLELVHVYVGNTSLKHRTASQIAEGLDIYNGLPDRVEGPALLVIRLGALTHYNKSGANVIQEVLNIRENLALPTWLVEPDHKNYAPYTPGEYGTSSGMPSCDHNVLAHIEQHYEKVYLEAVEGQGVEAAPYEEDDQGNITLPSEARSEPDSEPDHESDDEPEAPAPVNLEDLMHGGQKQPFRKSGGKGSWKR